MASTFDVYCAGETLDGTDIGITYIYITTPLGRIRMTEDEAEELGQKLTAAAQLYRDEPQEEQQ